MDQYLTAEEPLLESASPVTLSDLERVLTQSPALAGRFQPHPEFARARWLRTDGRDVAVTFEPALFDAHPNTLQLLTYGNDLLNSLLKVVPEPASNPEGRVLRCSSAGPLPLCAYYTLDTRGQPQRVEHLADLEMAIVEKAEAPVTLWSEENVATARADFQRELATLWQRQSQVIAARQRAERLAVEEQARQTLLQAALVELAMGQQPELLAAEALPMAFTEEAVTGLRRHRYPFAPLLLKVNTDGLRPSPTDPFYVAIQGQSREALKGQFYALKDKASRLVGLLANHSAQEAPPQPPTEATAQTLLL